MSAGKHEPILTVHAVPYPHDGLTAICGEAMGRGGNTGHIDPRQSIGRHHVCRACIEGEWWPEHRAGARS